MNERLSEIKHLLAKNYLKYEFKMIYKLKIAKKEVNKEIEIKCRNCRAMFLFWNL